MPSNALLAIGTGAGVAMGWILRSFLPVNIAGRRFAIRRRDVQSVSSSVGNDLDLEDLTDDEDVVISNDGEYKMVIVIRNDLKMGKGKIAAQSCHAAVGGVKKLLKTNPDMLKSWEYCGQPKVVTKVNDQESLYALVKKANAIGLTTCLIRDAGRTQIAPGSVTALAVGPVSFDMPTAAKHKALIKAVHDFGQSVNFNNILSILESIGHSNDWKLQST